MQAFRWLVLCKKLYILRLRGSSNVTNVIEVYNEIIPVIKLEAVEI